MGEWVYHRDHGVGEVLERDGRSRLVRFSDRVELVHGKFRPLAEDSLEVRAYRDLDGFLAWLDAEPGEAAIALLRGHRDGIDATQAIAKLIRLGVDDDRARGWWTASAEHALRQRADVTTTATAPERFVLAEGPDAKAIAAEASEVLERLARKRLTPDQRTSLMRQFRNLDQSGVLASSVRGAAAALGVRISDAPPLREVEPGDLPADVVRRLLERDEPRFVIRAVVDARGPETAREAAERAVALSGLVERAGHAAEVMTKAADEIGQVDGDRLNSTAERLANRVGRLRLLVSDGATPALVAAAVQLVAAAVARRSDDKQLERLRRTAETAVPVGDGDAGPFVGALRLESVEALGDDLLAEAWSGDRLAPDSTRLAWLHALAGERPGALAHAQAWRAVDVPSLQLLVSADDVRRWLFETATGRERFQLIVRAVLRRLDRAALAELVTADSGLLERLPAAQLREALDSLADREPSLEVIRDGFAASQLEQAERRHQEDLERLERRHREALRAAEERVEAAERLADRHAADTELARRLVQSASSGAAGAAEIRQARLDGLRLATELLAEVDRAGRGSPEIAEAADRLRAIAAAKGVRSEASVGDVVPFDHRRHRPVVDEALTDGQPVTIVEPAWVVGEGDDVTAVRYGLVRGQIQRAEGGVDGRDDAGGRLRDDDDAGGQARRAVQQDDPPGRAATPLDADPGGSRS